LNSFNPGLPIEILHEELDFRYGEGVFGPKAERRTLDSIRRSLRQPNCSGPETVYSIAMDVGKYLHKPMLEERMLLFGIVTYASGKLGDEPIRSQGHIHKVSVHSGWSPPEVYEIWSGSAYIYMQETAKDYPGRCYAVYAKPGDVVIVPPYWAHATISADPDQALTFGAWCDREYGFEYDEVRQHQGLAWYPIIHKNGSIQWKHNEAYEYTDLEMKSPGDYSRFGIMRGVPIYRQFEEDPDRFQWVSKPQLLQDLWRSFVP
jgi:glucose-6-phosphate isomerase